MPVFSSCLESAYGRIETSAPSYQPLDEVTVRVWGRPGDQSVWVRASDPDQRLYGEWTVSLQDGQGEFQFTAGGKLGMHYLYLLLPGDERNQGRWSRYTNFELDCDTRIESGDPDFDWLYPFTRDRVRLGRRAYDTPAGRFVGYISGDTWHFDGLWLRDWIYQYPAYRFWEREITCGLDRFLERQEDNGMIHDGIEREGHTWRVGLESDVEYILALGVWGAWQASGKDAWLRAALPKLEKAFAYIRSNPKHWDEVHQLVKRQHSCDTWDYDMDGATDLGQSRHVIAACDQTGYTLAFALMSRMYAALGEAAQAEAWAAYAAAYRQRANDLLWDGCKFRHHVHLDPIEHDGFDESEQLAMGNTWAMTRGLASPQQARAIVDEYARRHTATGDRYPWWSLQPGYPDELNYWKDAFRQQGGYANGGLMPWVGGELCRGALLHGRESYGVERLREWAAHLRREGGAHVWYWPDGQAGFRTTNEVNYTGWGMCEWINALFEGLAGLYDEGSLFRQVTLSPRWSAAGIQKVGVWARYAASEGYLAYRYEVGEKMRITITGSGGVVNFHVLLPDGFLVQQVTSEGAPLPFTLEWVDASPYVNFSAALVGTRTVEVS